MNEYSTREREAGGHRRRWGRWVVRGIAVLLLLVIASGFGGYWYATRPAQLRERVREALERAGLRHVEIGDLSFSFERGVELRDVCVYGEEPLAKTAGGGRGGDCWFRAERIVAHCDVSALFTGRVAIDDVEIDEAELTFVHRPGAGLAGEALRLAGDQTDLSSGFQGELPTLRLRQADLRLMEETPEGRQLVRRWMVTGAGRQTRTGYVWRVDWLGEARARLAELTWNAADGEFAAVLHTLDIETVARFMPSELRRTIEAAELEGRIVQLEARLSAGAPGQAKRGAPLRILADFERLSGVLPVETAEELAAAADGSPAGLPFLHFRESVARLDFFQRMGGAMTAVLSGAGRLNDADVDFELQWSRRRGEAGAFDPQQIVHARVDVEGLSLPTADAHPAFINSPRLPGPVRKFFVDFAPEKRCNVHFSAKRAADAAADVPLRVAGYFEALGGFCRPREFPYDFHDVRGRIEFAEGTLRVAGMTARHGLAHVRAYGGLNSTRNNAGFDLYFDARNVPLNDDLFAALPERYREVWARAAPLGLCDTVVRLRRPDAPPEGSAAPTRVTADVELLAGSLSLPPDRRITRAAGAFTIDRDQIEFEDLHGYDSEGVAIRLRGTLGIGSRAEATDVVISAADVPIDLGAAAEALGDANLTLSGQGAANVWGRVRGHGLQAEETSYVVELQDGTLRTAPTAAPWTDCRGWIRTTPAALHLNGFTAKQGDAKLYATGALPLNEEAPPISLFLRVENADLPVVLEQLVPAKWRRSALALGLAGQGSVILQVHSRQEGAPQGPPVADVQFEASRMQPPALPLALRGASIHARVSEGDVQVLRAAAAHGEHGMLQGSGNWAGGQGDFQLHAEGMYLSPQVVDCLPEKLADLLRRLTPDGKVDVALDRITVEGGAGGAWQFTGRIAVAEGTLKVGLPLTDYRGELRGTCRVGPEDRVAVDAELHVAEGSLAGRRISDWRGRLVYEPGERWVRIEELRGALCGGDALGAVRIDPDTAEYEVSLTLRNVLQAELLPPKDPEKVVHGRLDGNITLRGLGNDPASRTGGGDFRIRGASLLNTPVLAEVAEASPEQVADSTAAAELIEIRFVWHGSTLTLTRVEMQSSALRLVGRGTWDLETDALDLTLLGSHPRNWPRVLLLSDLLERAGQELLEYHVEGTAQRPRVRVEPLHKVNDALRALLGEGR